MGATYVLGDMKERVNIGGLCNCFSALTRSGTEKHSYNM